MVTNGDPVRFRRKPINSEKCKVMTPVGSSSDILPTAAGLPGALDDRQDFDGGVWVLLGYPQAGRRHVSSF